MALRRWARTGSAAFAVALSLLLGLGLPIVLSFYTSKVAPDAVEAAPSDAFTLSHPVVLSASPGVSVERGTLVFLDANGNALPHTSAVAPSSLRLFNATIAVGLPARLITARTAATSSSSFPASPYVEMLQSGKYESLSLRNSTILLHGFFETPEQLTDFKGEVTLKRRGTLAIKGSGNVRGRAVSVDVTANLAQAERRGTQLQRVPLKAAIKGELVDFALDGRLVMSPEDTELQGQGEISIGSGRGFARWFGAYWPTGPGLRDISVRGQMSFAKQNLSIERAIARLDGNEGTGVLNLRLRQPRPLIAGTLAFKAFDTKPYMTAAAADGPKASAWSTFTAGPLTVPLGMHLDADLRISADRIAFGAFEIGHSAATIALKDGRLLADVADLKFNGGEGGGQLTADFTGFMPKVGVRGKLEQVELGPLTNSLAGVQLMSGKAGIIVDLTGSGGTLQDVIRSFTGKLSVRGQSPGRLGLDLRGISTAVRSGEISGWGPSQKGSTGYDAIDLRLVLRDGTILTETAEARTPEGTWTAVGVLNLTSDRVDLRLSQSASAQANSARSSNPPGGFDLQGSLRDPRMKASAGP